VERSAVLPDWARARITERLAGRLAGGVLTVAASDQRNQLANRQGARARLAALLRDAVAPPRRPRVPTRPGRGANERRLEAKRQRAAIKRRRRIDRADPD
jgi:ribosome-associated protein